MPPEPLLFLDVDGVLNADPAHCDTDPVWFGQYPVHIPNGTAERIQRLSQFFEPVWATSWKADAHEFFAGHFGLEVDPPWDHIEFGRKKLPRIMEYALTEKLSGYYITPWVWIDDSAALEVVEFGVRADGEKGLAITTDPQVGLTDDDVDRALEFARSCKDGYRRLGEE